MARVGGAALWLKGPSSLVCRTPPGYFTEVLVQEPVIERVLSTIERQAREDGLQLTVRRSPPSEARCVLEVSLWKGSEPFAHWRFREVPRILRAAIVIDDLGANLDVARRLLALPFPITLSVLPGLRYSIETAEQAHRQGRAVMLHLPMEPERPLSTPVDPRLIRVGMTPAEVTRLIDVDLASVPYAGGVNNHMGSRATTDPELMREVMQTLVRRHLYFIDSRTTPRTVALRQARAVGVPSFYRAVFIDDTETVAYTLGQLERFCRVIRQEGAALAIGHPHLTTIEALARFLPALERHDIQLIPASELVRLVDPPPYPPARLRRQRTSHQSDWRPHSRDGRP